MSEGERGTSFVVTLRFHGDLSFFLASSTSDGRITHTLREKTSVKDVIESCGVPHPEVDLVLCDGTAVDFAFQLTRETVIEVYPVSATRDGNGRQGLQRRHLTRFVVDGHLGKLVRNLRLLGFDTLYRNDADDRWLLRMAVEQERALLTRDRRLLMHAIVRDGFCPRSDVAEEQIVEVAGRFDLRDAIAPFTRCLRCNGMLEAVSKAEVMDQLEPLTKAYYNDFRRCAECRRIYWTGSHCGKLQARIARIRASLT